MLAQVQRDNALRLNAQPKAPPTPTLGTFAIPMADGARYAAVTVTWSPVRKDIDYLVRWRRNTDSNYTYERISTSPHVIKLIETGKVILVGLAAQLRQNGATGEFGSDASITTAT